MRTYLVNYATDRFLKAQKRLNKSARKFGIDHCLSYTGKDILQTEFYQKNRGILEQARGAGFWLWKPYIILQALEQANDGDVIIYSDSGAEIIDSLQPLLDLCVSRNGLIFFQVPCYTTTFVNKSWTKRDCFILMEADNEDFHQARQVAGSPSLFIKNKANIDFVRQWLLYCEDPRIITDQPNTCGKKNYPEFYDHRHDQSILSILVKRNGLEIFRDPSQFAAHLKLKPFRIKGELPEGVNYSDTPTANSKYGTLFNLHREKNFSLSSKLNSLWQKMPSLRVSADQDLEDKLKTVSITIGITTFADRFDKYFKPLLNRINEFENNTEIIVAVNGEHDQAFNEEYRQKILTFLASHQNVFPIMFPVFRGVSKLWNSIIIHATNNYILMLNDDIMINSPTFIKDVKRYIILNNYRSFTINKSWSHFLISRAEIDYLGYFDERLLGIGEEDGDISWRYFHEYRRQLADYKIKYFDNFAEETVSSYKPINIECHSGTKYSRFNRNFIQKKYKNDPYGIPGLFGQPVRLADPGPEQYPNEWFYHQNKNKL
ncbi:glycosyltransferase family 2 protein [Desulfobacterota bacterium M19]